MLRNLLAIRFHFLRHLHEFGDRHHAHSFHNSPALDFHRLPRSPEVRGDFGLAIAEPSASLNSSVRETSRSFAIAATSRTRRVSITSARDRAR